MGKGDMMTGADENNGAIKDANHDLKGFGETTIRKILDGVQNGRISIDEAVGRLRISYYDDMGFAKVDHHRHLRQGFPEVVYCQGKSTEHIVAILNNLAATSSGNILATRAVPEVFEAVRKELPEAEYHALARVITMKNGIQSARGNVLVVTAGTADIPVAEEAAITCEMMGNKVERLFDVGVAGLHRFLNNTHMLYRANVIVVIAGMEGALASVVGGMVDKPVIAVPTSVGYGASLNGIAALLSMLNSCSSNVSVVNIDNGFGGGYIAGLINKIAVGAENNEAFDKT